MPRDGSGNYSLPAGYLAVTGETISADQHNPPLEDLASAITGSLPRDGSAPMSGNLQMGGKKVTGLADATGDDEAVTKSQLDTVSTNVLVQVPIGAITDFAGSTAPTNWLFCYGQAISRTTYADLYAALGTAYGAGDGSTTFNLPDCRGRVTAGKDDMGGTAASRLTTAKSGVNGASLGGSGGSEEHTLTEAQMPEHTHSATVSGDGTHGHPLGSTTRVQLGTDNGTAYGVQHNDTSSETFSGGTHTHTVTNGDAGSDQAHNNVQPTIVFNKIIKVLKG